MHFDVKINLIGSSQLTDNRLEFGVVSPDNRANCIAKLAEAGFYKFIDEYRRLDLSAKFIASGNVDNDLFDDETMRCQNISGENFVEEGFGRFVVDFAPMLASCGLALHIDYENWDYEDQKYLVLLNGMAIIPWQYSELVAAQGGRGLATDRVIQVANLILQLANREDRLYYSTDNLAVLLTPKMHAILRSVHAIQVYGTDPPSSAAPR